MQVSRLGCYNLIMLLEIKKIMSLSVGALDVSAKVGDVEKIIVDPKEIKVIGFLIKIGTIFPKFKVVSFQDVIELDDSGIVIGSNEDLLEREEIVRIKDLLKYKFTILGLRVKEENGQKIGFIEDGLIDSQTGDLLRIYTRDLLNIRKLVFERSRIIKMDLKEVVVKTEAKIKIKKEELETAKKAIQTA